MYKSDEEIFGKLTPKYVINAKYRGILQIVLASNTWEYKYPLLEKMIDELIAGIRHSDKEAIREELIEELIEWAEKNRFEDSFGWGSVPKFRLEYKDLLAYLKQLK